MKLATYRWGGQRCVGRVDGSSLTPLLQGEAAAEGVLAILDRQVAGQPLPAPLGAAMTFAGVELEAPIPRPRRNLFCVGKNYHAHAHEFTRSGFDSSAANAAEAIPEAPIVFSKVPESVIAPGAPIVLPRGVSEAVDYEAELAVIIGRGGRGISTARAMDHVWGYTIINDVTARDLQGRHKQWLLAKSCDTFCPMGPVAVTADEVDIAHLQVRCWVNDELRQDANTAELIFDIPTLIATISAGITLKPGDIIATGTPAGVGIGFNPPRYLAAGDRVRVEITGLGSLDNPVQ